MNRPAYDQIFGQPVPDERLVPMTPPPLPVAPPEGCPAPQQEPAGLGAVSSLASGPVDYDAMLADVEAKAQRALQMTTGKRTSARLQISPWASLFIYWERPKPPKKWWQFWI